MFKQSYYDAYYQSKAGAVIELTIFGFTDRCFYQLSCQRWLGYMYITAVSPLTSALVFSSLLTGQATDFILTPATCKGQVHKRNI